MDYEAVLESHAHDCWTCRLTRAGCDLDAVLALLPAAGEALVLGPEGWRKIPLVGKVGQTPIVFEPPVASGVPAEGPEQ